MISVRNLFKNCLSESLTGFIDAKITHGEKADTYYNVEGCAPRLELNSRSLLQFP